jgi:hypothetical protein
MQFAQIYTKTTGKGHIYYYYKNQQKMKGKKHTTRKFKTTGSKVLLFHLKVAASV